MATAVPDRETVLRTGGLTRKFGELVAVDDVDLAIEHGEFRSIIGPNGAGKTTLFNLISGALEPSSGSISLRGEDITDLGPPERVASGLSRSFQLTTVFNGLSVRENIRVAVQASEFSGLTHRSRFLSDTGELEAINDRTGVIIDRIQLSQFAETQASNLAYGDRRRLEIGLALATDPEVVLLDEPTAGMSGDETEATIELIENVLAEKTLILVEHDVDLVMRISDRISVLNSGEMIATGTPQEISNNSEVQDAYLGGYNP